MFPPADGLFEFECIFFIFRQRDNIFNTLEFSASSQEERIEKNSYLQVV